VHSQSPKSTCAHRGLNQEGLAVIVHIYEVQCISGCQGVMQLLGSGNRWRQGLAALLILASGSLSAAPVLPNFPAKPADVDSARWTALQNAVEATPPASTELTASDGPAGGNFGYSVALSGTTAIVGAYLKANSANGSLGAVDVFTFNGSTWEPIALVL
jgi:FG-GAP repeat